MFPPAVKTWWIKDFFFPPSVASFPFCFLLFVPHHINMESNKKKKKEKRCKYSTNQKYWALQTPPPKFLCYWKVLLHPPKDSDPYHVNALTPSKIVPCSCGGNAANEYIKLLFTVIEKQHTKNDKPRINTAHWHWRIHKVWSVHIWRGEHLMFSSTASQISNTDIWV